MPVTVTRSGRVSNAPRGWGEYIIGWLSPSANSGSANGGDSAPLRGSRPDIETQQLNETNDNDIQQELDLENISDSDTSLNESINESNNGPERETDDVDEEGEEGKEIVALSWAATTKKMGRERGERRGVKTKCMAIGLMAQMK